MNLFNLFAKLTLDNSEYEAKMKDSQKTASSFSSKIGTAFKTGARAVVGFTTGVVAAGAAMAALAMNFINAGSEIDDNAQKLGISTEAYQYWSLVLQRAGSDASQLSMAIRNMTTFVENLSAGQGDALLTLQKLGIGYEDFMAMNTEEKLYAIVEALQGMESQTDKVTIAQDIFGNRVYQELLPLLGMQQGSLEDLREEFEGLGLVLSDNTIKNIAAVGDKVDNLTNTIKTAGLVIGSNLLPEIELITEGLVGLANGSDDAMQSLSDGLVGLIDKVAEAIPSILDTGGNLLVDLLAGMVDIISEPKIIDSLTKVVSELLFKIVEILPTLTESLFDIAAALIDGLLNINWGDLIVDLLKSLLEIVLVNLPNMLFDVMSSVIDTVLSLFSQDGLAALAEFGVSFAEAVINGLISGIESGINIVVDFINGFLNGVSSVWTWIPGVPGIPNIPHVSIPRVDFAEGGMFDGIGTMYLARAGEAGAEIVAHGSRGTGVANIEQIADAQFMAMNDYGLKEIINSAAAAMVNGIVTGLKMNNGSGINNSVTVKIGEKEFKSYIVDVVNSVLKAQGRKTLNTVTAY